MPLSHEFAFTANLQCKLRQIWFCTQFKIAERRKKKRKLWPQPNNKLIYPLGLVHICSQAMTTNKTVSPMER